LSLLHHLLLAAAERYHLYKVGPVICVSHGMGIPSMMILLHEISKLMFYCKATNYVFIRIGTAGGLGMKAGEVVFPPPPPFFFFFFFFFFFRFWVTAFWLRVD